MSPQVALQVLHSAAEAAQLARQVAPRPPRGLRQARPRPRLLLALLCGPRGPSGACGARGARGRSRPGTGLGGRGWGAHLRVTVVAWCCVGSDRSRVAYCPAPLCRDSHYIFHAWHQVSQHCPIRLWGHFQPHPLVASADIGHHESVHFCLGSQPAELQCGWCHSHHPEVLWAINHGGDGLRGRRAPASPSKGTDCDLVLLTGRQSSLVIG